MSSGGAECVVVVPCYNEAGRLRPDAFLEFLPDHSGFSFLFVDDGSTDATREILGRLCRESPHRLACMRLEQNRGKAEAVRRGMLHALSGNPAVVGFWDADLSTPLDAIPLLHAHLLDHGRLEMVLGARVLLLGRRIERKASRHYLGRVFATFVSLTLRLPIYDTQCGAKLFRDTPRLRAVLEEEFRSRWIFDVELLARWLSRREEGEAPAAEIIHEFPLPAWREVGESKIRPRDFLKAPLELFRIRRRYPLRRAAAEAAPRRS